MKEKEAVSDPKLTFDINISKTEAIQIKKSNLKFNCLLIPIVT